MIGVAIGVPFSAQNALAQYLVYDNFQRPNSTTSLGTTLTGQTWQPLNGTWGIESDNAYCSNFSTAYGGNDVAVVDCGKSDYTATATISKPFLYGGICFSATSATQFVFVQFNDSTFTGLSVYEQTSTGTTLLGQFTISAFAAGDTLGVEVTGNIATVLVNGVSVGSLTIPSSVLGGLSCGLLEGDQTNGMKFAQFEVEP